MNLRYYGTIFLAGVICLGLMASDAYAESNNAVPQWMLQENPEAYPLAKIKTGQIAEGISVFSSTKGPEIFKVEILGVVEKFFGPAGDLIIARLYGGVVDKTGVVAGMSGSPVFMDKKLVGAVGYRFGAFTKDAIAGITPIEQMKETFLKGQKGNSKEKRQTTQTPWGNAVPLASPLMFSGLVPEVQTAFAPVLAERGYGDLLPALGAGAGGSENTGLETHFFPGGPIATTLVDGDMKMAGIGTVTWVQGEQFLAFGHPFMGLGTIEMPVSYATIITTVASDAGSWKLGRPTLPAGTLTHDRIFAIGGTTSKKPKVIPLTITLKGKGFGISSGVETFNYRIANHPRDLAIFTAIVSANTLESRNIRTLGGTLNMSGNITLADPDKKVEVRETIVRHRSSLGMPTAFALLDLLDDLLNYELTDVKVAAVDLQMHHDPKLHVEEILGVRWNKGFHAGEKLRLWIQLKPFQSEILEEAIDIQLPNGLQTGTYRLEILDHRSYRAFAQKQGLLRRVDSYDAYLRQRETLPSSDEMTLVLISKKTGVKLRGTNVQPLPPKLKRLLKEGAGYVRKSGEGFAIDLGRFKRPGHVAGKISTSVEVLAPKKKQWR